MVKQNIHPPSTRLLSGKKTRFPETNEQSFVFKNRMFMPMITYEKILEKPQLVDKLTGLSLAEFERLYTDFELAYLARTSKLQYTRRHKAKRQRAVGGGRKYRYSLRDRLLMTLFWLRAYTTYEVLACLYDLHKSTIEDNLNDVLETLATMRTLRVERPPSDVPKLRSAKEVFDLFPEVLLMLPNNKV